MNECPNCRAKVGGLHFIARRHILWANQHGWKCRIFCHRCGQWSDVTEYRDMTPIRVEVRKHPYPDEIPF